MTDIDDSRRVRQRTNGITLTGGAPQSPDLVQMWRDQRLTDLTVNVTSGETFAVHRIVLAAGSEHIRGLLEGATLAAGAPLLIPSVSSASFGLILEWLYTGTCTVENSELAPLAMAANYMMIISLQKAAEEELASRVTLETCRDMWRLASSHNLRERLESAAKAMVLQIPVEEYTPDELRQLELEQLSSLVADDDLRGESEGAIFDFIMRWADAQASRPNDDQLRGVMRSVRFTHMPRRFLRERVAPLPIFNNSLDGLRLLRDGLLDEPERRRGCGPCHLYAIGGVVGGEKRVDRFDIATSSWTAGPQLGTLVGTSMRAVRLGTHVFAFQDGQVVAEVMDDGSGLWNTTAPMNMARRNFALAAAGGRIFAIGGATELGEAATVDCYDPAVNSWTVLPSQMSVGRTRACAVTLRGEIYVMGGVHDAEIDDLVEKYNPQTGVWTVMPSMPTARYGAGAAVLGGKIYVAGGSVADDDGFDTPTSVVEVFDPTTQSWTTSSPMIEGRMFCHMSAVLGCLYATGGNGYDRHPTIERYDPEHDQWIILRSDGSADAIRVPPPRPDEFGFA